MKHHVYLILLMASGVLYAADTPQSMMERYATEAKAEQSDFQGFSAERGEVFFKSTHGGDWSCASCHTSVPTQSGEHAGTGKTIKPLAPSVNSERFTRLKKTEKWFKRNCNDVLDRPCTAVEKGDVMTYLLSL
ncbi:MAG: DUF1924 domain-containing protein [Gammaproteobacteria bacterium]|nr:DUF1924 domain-containing protein [Gammaproteobacteria bacterium]